MQKTIFFIFNNFSSNLYDTSTSNRQHGLIIQQQQQSAKSWKCVSPQRPISVTPIEIYTTENYSINNNSKQLPKNSNGEKLFSKVPKNSQQIHRVI